VVRALHGVWRFIDGARKVFLNLLFLLFMVILLSVMFQDDQHLTLQNDTTLVLRPYGMVVEDYSSTPMDRAVQQALELVPPETRLRDLVEAVERAAKDPHISQMVIDTDYLWGIGLSSLHDLERAVEHFRSAGKPVVAVGEAMGQNQYYLASMADEVWLNPDGAVWIDGYANYRNFYREGLEKLAVEVNLFRVGEYKSAMEPWIRDDMSPEAKEAALYWLGSLWQQYLEGISQHRGIPLESISAAIDQMADRVEAVDGDLAQFALQLGLVDRLVSAPEARQELALRGAPNKDGDSFRAVGVEEYLELASLRTVPRTPEVVVLVAEGEITSGERSPGAIGAETTARQLRDIGVEEGVQAVVLRINSPGGEALASEKIRRELKALQDAGKTVVVSMGDVAASGGYWIAMDADEIWANPSTITGSIGVYGMIPTFGATLAKVGVYSDGVGTTPMAGKLRVDRPLDPDLRRIFQSTTEHIYDDFLGKVAAARSMEVSEVDAVARGRVWSGSQAAERGLVDRVGSLQDAVDAAARIAGLGPDYRVDWYEAEVSPIEEFMLGLTSGALAQLQIGSANLSALSWTRQGFVQQLLQDIQRISRNEGQLTIAAHCMCSVR
jgi:protease-4